MYNFFININTGKPYNPKTYTTDHARYFRDLYKYTAIAEQMKQVKVPYYIELLMATPIHDWPKLRQYLIKQGYLSNEKD